MMTGKVRYALAAALLIAAVMMAAGRKERS